MELFWTRVRLPPSPPPIYYVSIEQDKKELSDFQKSLKYKIVKVGDIVKEVHWIAVEPDELLTGTVVAVEKV